MVVTVQILREIEAKIAHIEHGLEMHRQEVHYELKAIKSALQGRVNPAPQAKSLDWERLNPRIWWAAVILILTALQIPLPEAVKIASQLF